jgi:hypothetical protein
MRNRIAPDDGAVDFQIGWAVTQEEVEPLIAALEVSFASSPSADHRG